MTNVARKTNLFVFWLGDQKQFDKSRYDTSTFNLIIGPSKEEHNFLYENYPYYKHGYDYKKYSFCSDIWRLFVLSKNKGLYIDASVITGKDARTQIKHFESFDVVAFRGNYKYIESGVLWSGKKDNEFYSRLLNFYEKEIPITAFVMPVFLSKQFFEYGFNFGWGEEIKDGIALLPLTEIRNKNSIWKTSVGSWSYSSKKPGTYLEKAQKDGWSNWEKAFMSKSEDKYRSIKVERAMKGAIIDVAVLRMLYDLGSYPRKKLEKDYENIDYKIKLFERLIWSKLFVIFSNKKKKVKSV